MKNNQIFSFAANDVGPLSRLFIRLSELTTGQPKLKKIYDNYLKEERPAEYFWNDAVTRLDLKINIISKKINPIPKYGKLLIVSNHPFGVADGITICSIVTKVRNDVKLLTHEVLSRTPAISHQILPIDFSKSKNALINNIKTKNLAQRQLENEGVVIIFPNGEISSSKKLNQKVIENKWKNFASKLALKSKAPVLPLYFEGQNSKAFHIANKIGQTFRYSLMMYELRKKMGEEINVHIGSLINNKEIKSIGNLKEITDFLHKETYKLDPENYLI